MFELNTVQWKPYIAKVLSVNPANMPTERREEHCTRHILTIVSDRLLM